MYLFGARSLHADPAPAAYNPLGAMASVLKKTVSKPAEAVKATAGAAVGQATDKDEKLDEVMKDKYLLKISAGPSYDLSTHKPVFVNTENATVIENEYVTAKIKVRIRGYQGLPRGSASHSPYFDDEKHINDQYSVGFSFVPKKDLSADGAVWGNDFPHPVRDRLPPAYLVSAGWKIFKTFIDPGCDMDAYADEPWLYGPVLSTWFTLNIGEQLTPEQFAKHPGPPEENPTREGAEGDDALAIRQKYNMPDDGVKRRKHFLTKSNSEGFVFEKGRLYEGDFYNPYIDFSSFKLKLPGLSISAARYINDKTHNLRYVFKNVKTGEVYFVVVFTLLHGNDVDAAVEEDNKRVAEEEAAGLEKVKSSEEFYEVAEVPEEIST